MAYVRLIGNKVIGTQAIARKKAPSIKILDDYKMKIKYMHLSKILKGRQKQAKITPRGRWNDYIIMETMNVMKSE